MPQAYGGYGGYMPQQQPGGAQQQVPGGYGAPAYGGYGGYQPQMQ